LVFSILASPTILQIVLFLKPSEVILKHLKFKMYTLYWLNNSLLFPLLIALFCNCTASNQNYFIETAPYTLCTVHLKTFERYFEFMQVFEEIVNANQNEHVLWTLWTDKAKDFIQPSIHFQERCTVNIVIEDYFQQNKVREYTMSTLRVYRLERVLYTICLVSF
jgi:hypothetical protein